jgi:hypothetical protein
MLNQRRNIMSETGKEAKLIEEAVSRILNRYDDVATGDSRGANGCFYADGKGTLNAVNIDVEDLERLAKAVGRKVHPRDWDYRYGLQRSAV